MHRLGDTSRTKRAPLRPASGHAAAEALRYRESTDAAADAGELILDLRDTMVYHGRAWWKLSRVGLAIMDQFWYEVASWNV